MKVGVYFFRYLFNTGYSTVIFLLLVLDVS